MHFSRQRQRSSYYAIVNATESSCCGTLKDNDKDYLIVPNWHCQCQCNRITGGSLQSQRQRQRQRLSYCANANATGSQVDLHCDREVPEPPFRCSLPSYNSRPDHIILDQTDYIILDQTRLYRSSINWHWPFHPTVC